MADLAKLLDGRQSANALLALRLDTKRQLLADLSEINDEIIQLKSYIKQCNDNAQMRLFN